MTNRNQMKKTQKVSFNIVDVLITAVIVLFLAYTVLMYATGGSPSDIGSKEVNVEYTVVIEDVSTDYFHQIKIGDAVKSRDGSVSFGKVTRKMAIAEDGSATVIIQATALRSNGSYHIDEQIIDPGTELEIRFTDYAPFTTIRCVGIKIV